MEVLTPPGERSPINVAIFASQFYPHVGGVEELCRQLAHAYKDTAMQAIVVTNRWPRSLPVFEAYEGIPVYRLAMRVPEGTLKARVSYRLTHRSVHRQVLRILATHRIEVLHVQCVGSNGYYALRAKRSTGLPLVVTIQGERTMDAARVYDRSAFQNWVLRDLLTESDYVTACSKAVLSDIEAYYGRSLCGRARVIYNGIRLADFSVPEAFGHHRKFILGIGRLAPQKGFDVLIDAYAAAKLRSYDLIIAGDGTERDALKARIRELGLQAHVYLPGCADRKMAVALFSNCAFFVLPSRQEPQGIVILEAMAAGRAVIASRVGGVPEIVQDRETGLLIPADDVGALAAAMTRLARDETLQHALGDVGRIRVRDFDWPVIAEQYRAIYQQISDSIPMPSEF